MTSPSNVAGTLKGGLKRYPRLYRLARGVFHLITKPRYAIRQVVRGVRQDGTFADESELEMCSLQPTSILETIIERYQPRSVLDVGCGTGQSLGFFVDRGIDAWGVEGSALAIERSPVRSRIVHADLRKKLLLSRRFDLVWSYEVVEHIHPRFIETLMDTLTTFSDRVVMSAAQPLQGGGEGHLNEQPPSYWTEQFGNRGFVLDPAATEVFRALPDEFAQNMMVFERLKEPSASS